MGEINGLQTYISPDYDPAFLGRGTKKKGDSRIEVRLALPFSMHCTACNEFLYKGRKFNAKKETVAGEVYLGLKIYRFYIKCTRCSAHLTFKTDPKAGSYICETGCTRNFEMYLEEQAEKALEEEEAAAIELDPMQALESKTAANQAELDTIDALEEEQVRRGNIDRLSTAPLEVLAALDATRAQSEGGAGASSALNEHGLSAEDEAQLASVRFGASSGTVRNESSDSDSDTDGEKPPPAAELYQTAAPVKASASTLTVVRRKRRRDEDTSVPPPIAKHVEPATSALGSLAGYGSSSDSN